MQTQMTPALPANADLRPDEPCGHALFDACSAGDACARSCSRQLRAQASVIHLPPAAHILARRDAFFAAILITGLAIALSWLAALDTWPATIAAGVTP